MSTDRDAGAGTRRVALVTGGSRGIGRAVVARLAEDGFDVAFCFRSPSSEADTAVREAASRGARVFTKAVDVSDPAQSRSFVDEAEDELGPLHTVVTAAGITRDKVLARMDDEEWREVLSTNLDGTYAICRAATYRFMRRRSGRLITLSSVAGVYGNAGQTNYSASKAGIIGFTRALAKECGSFGVRANVVAPGFIDTDMTAAMSGKERKRCLERIPLARFGVADEVADLVSFLASDRAGYITGQVLGIDGGLVV